MPVLMGFCGICFTKPLIFSFTNREQTMKISLSKILKKSTRSFFEEAQKIQDFSLFDQLHGYVYLRWPFLYIGIAKGEHPISKMIAPFWRLFSRFWPKPSPEKLDRMTFADTYHGKVVPTEAASQLVTINADIRIDDLEKIIPYRRARSIIMNNPDHIAVLECPCRSVKENPCLPLDVCLVIGEPFASFAIEHHPERARWISQAEAVAILEAERQRGHVSHAFFKDAMLERFYAICNCCQCCCGAMKAHNNGTPMLASSGYVAKVDDLLCIGCGECQQYCQFGAISSQNEHALIDEEICMGCGVCEAHCQQGAITLVRDPIKGVPLEIFNLMHRASVSG
jgi:Pyruvate/2-oxoacid:ferredoxin oxidoreductase delta subunit